MSKESQGGFRADPRMVGDPEDSERRYSARVAIPLPSRPSLIPPDILEAYEQELKAQESVAAPQVSGESLVIDTEAPGLAAAQPAAPETARVALSKLSALSALPAQALAHLAEGAREGVLQKGEVLVHPGELPGLVHVVLAGELERLSPEDGRAVRLGPGESLGLFELLTGARRAATVRASAETLLLELDRATVERALSARDGLVEDVLSALQARLVHGFVASPLFEGLTPDERSALAARFEVRELKPGTALVSPGEVTHLLAVVLSGQLALEFRGKAGQERELETLEPGTFALVTSAFTGMPARMRVWAEGRCTVAVLPHRGLSAAAKELPSLAALPRRAPLHAQASCPDVWTGLASVPG